MGTAMNWQAESIHGVLFTNPNSGAPDALQPWMKAFGGPPQNYQQNAGGGLPGATAAGLIGDYQTIIVAQPGRLELAFTAPASNEGPPKAIADIRRASDILNRYFEKIVVDSRPNRVASVFNLVKKTANVSEATNLFITDTGLNALPATASDVQFSLNMKRDFLGIGREQNRLCRWSVATQQLFMMTMTVGSSNPAMAMTESYMEGFTIDVNTGAALAEGELDFELYSRVVEEALLIMEGGYNYVVA